MTLFRAEVSSWNEPEIEPHDVRIESHSEYTARVALMLAGYLVHNITEEDASHDSCRPDELA